MKVCYQFAILLSLIALGQAVHNCTSFNDKNHGFGCELRSVKPSDTNDFEITVMAKETDNKTDSDVTWVQIRESEFKNELPKGVFEKFENMEKIMILNSKGFKNLELAYFDKKIKLILMKATDLESIGENCLVGLGNLKILSLNYNNVNKVHRRAFRDLVNVDKIEMVNNKIEFLDDEVFANNVNLKTLLLYNNQLKVISAAMFAKNVLLESLQLQNNQITQIEKGFHTPLLKLTRVDLSSNLCISETLLPSRYILWSSFQGKFKDCFNNYALMKGSNDKMLQLESKVDEAIERVNNDVKIIEKSFANSSALDDLKSNLLEIFTKDKEAFKQSYDNELHNITSHVKTEMMEQIEKSINNHQDLRQERLVSDDFGSFRDEFAGKFNFIFVSLFMLFALFVVSMFLVAKKLDIFTPQKGYSDNRHLIDAENC